MRKILMFSVIFCCLLNQLVAQVSFVTSANKVVDLGENFRLTFTVNAYASNFEPPDLSAFNVLSGPSTSTSTNFQYINGKSSQSISNAYEYIIQAKKEGKFTIGKASINVEGKVYYSNPITIEVIKGSNKNSQNEDDQILEPTKTNNDIFIQTNIDKATVYQGEQIITTLKVYDRSGLKGFNSYKFPSFTGFYSQDIKQPSQISLDRENVNGKIYNAGILKQSILFPQQSGTLTIDPFELECVIQQKIGQRRNFFGELIDVYRDAVVKLKSSSKSVKVLPLPANAPASFSGAVGNNFQLKVLVDRTDLKSNESITLTAVLSGIGNLKTVDKLKINFPSSFEVYDPKINNNIENTSGGAKGSNTYEYLLIPREPGEYTISPIEFSYFDVTSKSYKVLKSQEIKFKITKGDNVQNYSTGVDKESVTQLGTDIRFITQDDFKLKTRNYSFFGSITFYLIYGIAIIIFLLLILILKQKIKQNKDISIIKNKRANKISQKRLKAASLCMKNGEKQAFYDEVIKALWGYLSDKLNIPVSGLSRETARETMIKKNINDLIVEDFIKVIDNCEFAKYAPSADHDQIEQDFELARRIINKLEQVL
jgi:hypothetical protein